jgi:hypothetical protein
MAKILQFTPRSVEDRKARLIQEARAIYERIFPSSAAGDPTFKDADPVPPLPGIGNNREA